MQKHCKRKQQGKLDNVLEEAIWGVEAIIIIRKYS
jgi:hypothetical protein